MKYAYIIGSNAFVVPSKVVSYAEGAGDVEFLRINAVYHDQSPPAAPTFLDCDINIKDTDGTAMTILANKAVTAASYTINTERDSVHVLRSDGSTLIHVHQLSDDAALALEHYIVAELEVNMPVAVIRIFGNFMLGGLHVLAENEKLYINKIGHANSALAGDNQLRFTTNGVVL